MDATLPRNGIGAQPLACERHDSVVSDIHTSIEVNLWLAGEYEAKGDMDLARECIEASLREYRMCEEIMDIYAGAALGERIRCTWVRLCGGAR